MVKGEVSGWNYANRGDNAFACKIGKITVYFSYQTPIAFSDSGVDGSTIASENVWGKTTGTHISALHLDSLPTTNKQIPQSAFELRLQALLEKYGLIDKLKLEVP